MSSAQPESSNNAPFTDLRHVTSNGHLASPVREHRLSKRTSQHLRTHRVGSRSPNSIPSSPTSVHSSSSAIFERDIEPINASPPLLTTDPHHIPRARHTEQLDQSVPSVLDSAAEILASSTSDEDALDAISIVAPAPTFDGSQSGFTSPISRLSSRSPSPTGNRRSILLNIPSPSPSFTIPLPVQQTSPQLQPQPHAGSVSPQVRPTVRTDAVPPTPSTSTPTSAYFSAAADSEASSPNTATHHEHPLHTLPTPISTSFSPLSPLSPAPSATLATLSTSPSATLNTFPSTAGSHPPSPKNPNKRLSFISYTDLLSSTPASTVPLSTLVLGSSIEPPPHLPSVIGLPQAQALQATGSSAASLRDAAGALVADPTSDLSNDVGGEWEREGLGRGLEERLESLMPVAGRA